MTARDSGKRLLWIVLLFIMAVSTAACSLSGRDEGISVSEGEVRTARVTEPHSMATSSPTVRTRPTATPTPAATITSTATVTPTIPAGPLQGEQLVTALRGGGYVIYFRHAATDPVPDDADPVDFSDCTTQRNLSAAGRTQASAIGEAVQSLEIPIGGVLSSPFCRALDTAQLAFGKATSDAVLENLETAESEAERETRVEGLRSLLSAPPDGMTNTVLVGHGFNIAGAADITIAEGEAAVFRPRGEGSFTFIATVTSQEWEELSAQLAK